MTWTAGTDRTTGSLVTASQWNALLGATGSLMETATAKVTTAGDTVYATGANALARLAIGTAGYEMHVNSAGTAPEWYQRPQVRVYTVSNQTISTSTATALAFDSERYKTVTGLHSNVTNNTRLIADRAGYWLVIGEAVWSGSGSGQKTLDLRVNGSTVYARSQLPASAVQIEQIVSTVLNLAASDYVELVATHDFGSSVSVLAAGPHAPEFMMTYLGP